MFWNFLTRLLEPATDLISEYIPDADKRAEFTFKLQQTLMQQETAFVEASRDVVVAEAQGESWLQRSWRPLTMLCFTAMIVNNYLFAPYVQAFTGTSIVIDIPAEAWGMLTVGLGGYVVGRTMEKTGSGVNINVGQSQAGPERPSV